MNPDEKYMNRCLQLAVLGSGSVSPNPMVGALLVHDGNIIGEGYHKMYGEAHAEVNCISGVNKTNWNLIPESTMYVSLEPCTHFGKTPPCTDLIIRSQIRKVVIGCQDIYTQVNGKGIQKLKDAGIEVITGVLENDCRQINHRFFTFHSKQRPYIILKWAESANHKIANEDFQRVLISNDYSNLLVHKWRSEEAAIMAGTNTILYDDPFLNNRHWTGKSPARLILDMKLRLPKSSNVFNREISTIVFNGIKSEVIGNMVYHKIEPENLLQGMMQFLYNTNLQSVLVEGGAKLIQSFIDENLWDEARVITNEKLKIIKGISSPVLSSFILEKQERYESDQIVYYRNPGKD